MLLGLTHIKITHKIIHKTLRKNIPSSTKLNKMFLACIIKDVAMGRREVELH